MYIDVEKRNEVMAKRQSYFGEIAKENIKCDYHVGDKWGVDIRCIEMCVGDVVFKRSCECGERIFCRLHFYQTCPNCDASICNGCEATNLISLAEFDDKYLQPRMINVNEDSKQQIYEDWEQDDIEEDVNESYNWSTARCVYCLTKEEGVRLESFYNEYGIME